MNMNSYKCCNDLTSANQQVLSQLSLLKLLSEKKRLQILCILHTKNHPVRDLVEHLQVSQSLVSHHLMALRELSLVKAEKSGRQVNYSLTIKGKNVIKLLKLLSSKEEK